MRFVALATDYDGTLAHHGEVPAHAIEALDRFVASGRKLILVTGRELDELLGIFPQIDRFDCVVAENGALLYTPATGERKPLGEPAPQAFLDALRERGVPMSVGASIVATVEPHEIAVLKTIRDLGLELQVIFNKGAVMVLPPSMNKATGLAEALERLGLSPHNVAAIGDAENDHALLQAAEYGVATGNAIETLRDAADRASARHSTDAVIELIDDILAHDLRDTPARKPRRTILLGEDGTGAAQCLPTAWTNILVAGGAGSGKSTLTALMLERLREQDYQFCVLDSKGAYEHLDAGILFGNAERAPSVEEVLTALEKPASNPIVNLVALPAHDRPRFFAELLAMLQALRAKSGRPHWLVMDDTHEVIPRDWNAAEFSQGLDGMIYVTAHPDVLAAPVARAVDCVLALGAQPRQTLQAFAEKVCAATPAVEAMDLQPGEALLWHPASNAGATRLRLA